MELSAVAADGRDAAVRAVVAQTIAHGPRQDAAGLAVGADAMCALRLKTWRELVERT
jgi:hypothetical protein